MAKLSGSSLFGTTTVKYNGPYPFPTGSVVPQGGFYGTNPTSP